MKRRDILPNSIGLLIGVACLVGSAAVLVQTVSADTNISSLEHEHFAWNDIVGWMDFYSTGTVGVGAHRITGYASSTAGDISLDCATTRAGDICGISDYNVSNDGAGNLSGYGWNDNIGWISFDCNNHGGCGVSNYRVYVDSQGIFQNFAWNDVVGWISFNCANTGGCAVSDYKVTTSWSATSTQGILDSTTFDTGSEGGAQLNSLYWDGALPADTEVKFQIATSNASSGPWSFIGPDGTDQSFYITNPGVSMKLDYSLHNNQRYFRYRAVLISNATQTQSPQVNEIRINWSP